MLCSFLSEAVLKLYLHFGQNSESLNNFFFMLMNFSSENEIWSNWSIWSICHFLFLFLFLFSTSSTRRGHKSSADAVQLYFEKSFFFCFCVFVFSFLLISCVFRWISFVSSGKNTLLSEKSNHIFALKEKFIFTWEK